MQNSFNNILQLSEHRRSKFTSERCKVCSARYTRASVGGSFIPTKAASLIHMLDIESKPH